MDQLLRYIHLIGMCVYLQTPEVEEQQGREHRERGSTVTPAGGGGGNLPGRLTSSRDFLVVVESTEAESPLGEAYHQSPPVVLAQAWTGRLETGMSVVSVLSQTGLSGNFASL